MLFRKESVFGNPEIHININPEAFFKTYKPLRDFDNVTSATDDLVVNEFNRIFGTKYLPVDIREWHSVRNWAIEKGLSKRDAEEVENHLWYNPDFLFKAKPVPGTCELSYWLYERSIGFPIISSRIDVIDTTDNRLKDMREATYEWMKKYEPWVPQKDIYIQKNNEMPGDIFKAFMAKMINCGIYFEDSINHTKTVLDYTDIIVILLSNHSILDNLGYENLVRISSDDRNLPNLLPFYDWVSRFDS